MTKEKIKAAFFDIDGTLAEMKSHVIPDSTRKALHRLREKGICCVLSTGRHPLEVSEENSFSSVSTVKLRKVWMVG